MTTRQYVYDSVESPIVRVDAMILPGPQPLNLAIGSSWFMRGICFLVVLWSLKNFTHSWLDSLCCFGTNACSV